MKNAERNSEPLDAILRRAMRETPGAATPECADAEALAAYWDKTLPAHEQERFEAHLTDCARCQMQLASIARADDSAREAHVESGGASDVPWYRRWGFAIPALAAAAAAMVVFNAIRRPANEQSQSPEEIAMAKREAPATSVPMPQAATAPAGPVAAPNAPTAAPPSNELAMNEARRAEAPRAEAKRAKQSHRMESADNPEAPAMSKSAGSAPPNAIPQAERGRVVAIAPAAPFVEPSTAAQAPPATQRTASMSSEAAMNQRQPHVAQREESKGYAPHALSEQATVPNTAEMGIRGGGVGTSAGAGATIGGTALGAGTGAIVGTAVGHPLASAAVGGNVGQSSVVGGLILGDISPPDHSVTWIVGKNGTVRRRDANGAMHPQHSGVTTDLSAGAAPSASICWIVGRSGTIIRTTDGGEHWMLITPPATENLAAVSAGSASDATITTAGGQRFATSDGGMSWRAE